MNDPYLDMELPHPTLVSIEVIYQRRLKYPGLEIFQGLFSFHNLSGWKAARASNSFLKLQYLCQISETAKKYC